MIKNSLALKLTSLVLLFSSVIIGSVIAGNYFSSRTLIIQQAEINSHTRGREIASQIEALIKPIEQTSRNIALALEDSVLFRQEISVLSKRIVQGNPKLLGLAIAYAPYETGVDQLYFAPYCYQDNGIIHTANLGSSDYRYFYMDWYLLPRELDRAIWTEPYYDKGGSETLITSYSAPFYRVNNGKKQFAGVVRADISLGWLQKMISEIKLYDTGYATILSRNGTYIYHPNQELEFNETIFTIAEEQNDTDLWQIGRNMIEGKSGFIRRDSIHDGTNSFFLYMPLPIGGWSLAFFFPVDEVLHDIGELTRNTLIISMFGFLLFSGTIFVITRKMTRPIRTLSRTTLDIAGGNLCAELPSVSSGDEVGQLTASFALMQDSLRDYIADLKETTSAKERIESELRIGREIQMGILPKTFPAFPEHKEFDIFAMLEPAREVGGDLYDFFFVDEHHLCFLIGDVSGKGVPAAFFMAVSKTLLKMVARQESVPGKILSKVNDELAKDNDSCMFVTLFLAIIDVRTGLVSYGNSGHNPPLLLHKQNASFLPPVNEPMAGAMPDITYSTNTIQLHSGDSLFFYTDGVTEAMNTDQELYSDQRLFDLLNEIQYNGVKELVQRVTSSVTDFAGDAEQSDDITMLALQYNGK